MKMCQHCQKAKVCRPRGLCWLCYYLPGVKELYPSRSKFAGRPGDATTMEELDRMITEQLPTMPANDEEPDEQTVYMRDKHNHYERPVVRIATRRRPARF